MPLTRLSSLYAALILTLTASAARAQTSYPMLMSLKPTAVQVGATSEHTLTSRYSMYACGKVLVSGTGVTAEVVTPMELGKDGKDPFGSAFDFAVQQTDMRFLNPLWRITEIFSGNARRMKNAVGVIDRYAYDAIRKRKQESTEERERRQINGREDLLDLFLKYRDDEGKSLSDVELRDVYVNFIIAG